MGIALLYAIGDVTNFYAQAWNTPGAYMCLLHCRTVPLALVWQYLMGKRLSLTRWIALVSCVYGSILKSHVDMQRFETDQSSAANITKYLPILVQICCGVFACVMNEKLLR